MAFDRSTRTAAARRGSVEQEAYRSVVARCVGGPATAPGRQRGSTHDRPAERGRERPCDSRSGGASAEIALAERRHRDSCRALARTDPRRSSGLRAAGLGRAAPPRGWRTADALRRPAGRQGRARRSLGLVAPLADDCPRADRSSARTRRRLAVSRDTRKISSTPHSVRQVSTTCDRGSRRPSSAWSVIASTRRARPSSALLRSRRSVPIGDRTRSTPIDAGARRVRRNGARAARIGSVRTTLGRPAELSLDESSSTCRERGERKRPSAGWASLTPTEVRVVALVAAGLTNPQIAERMSIACRNCEGASRSRLH